MRTRVMIIALLAGLACLTGCNGVVNSWDDRKHTYDRITSMDSRQIADDWDSIWLATKQSRLTRWYVR